MNANVGIVLREYNAETLAANLDSAWSIATQGGVPTSTAIAYDDDNSEIYITGRGNKAFTLAGAPDIETLNPGTWSVLMAKYKLPKTTTGISSVLTETGAEAEYYNLQGMKVDSRNLTPGIYIKRTSDKSMKTIIR